MKDAKTVAGIHGKRGGEMEDMLFSTGRCTDTREIRG